jgi:hypothetical protein
MFVQYYAHVSRRFDDVEKALLAGLHSLAGLGDGAYREGERLRAQIGIGGPLAKTVEVGVGAAVRAEDRTRLPLTWVATGVPGLFPKLEAEIVLAAVGPTLTQLTLQGSYQPPLGAVGRTVDLVLLHRLAEATVKRFVDDLAVHIEALLDAEVAPADGPHRSGRRR